MPTDLKNYIEKNRKEQDELIQKVLNDAARPLNMGVYISGAVAALVGGIAIAL